MISLVIPVLNEEEAAPILAKKLKETLQSLGTSYEIIFVDDGSTDRTLKVLLDLKSEIPSLKILELARRQGQTAALAAGINNANGDIIITMDGDLQHDPADIPMFLEKLNEGYDVVSGWRKLRTDNFVIRRIPSLVANKLMRVVSGINVKDFGSTFKAYRAEVLKQVELFGELHRFIPVLAARVGAKIIEVPISVHPRTLGTSKYNLGRVFGVFEDLIFLEFFLNYLTKPIRAFGKLFFYFFGVGFLLSFSLMFLWAIGTIEAVKDHSALLLFSVFLMTVGFQFLVVGILAEILSRIYHHTSGTQIYSIRKIHG